ncbi:ATP synthase subunit C [Parvularcula bermudensis HTCC2503]|uniref:ATP synthase subunit C n=1 Tax=Parvularcula bermudensis (strain ATCC BAA-594 / HTCC2503 / KCTC 12087) TaxID=314260 RepID=E0TFU9_PARBH|nr:hypothetical protein [Parvularcula bermudensis]ADM09114.1 ATP synthase subunit C [Parvularcula bermudensis HTCC2503]
MRVGLMIAGVSVVVSGCALPPGTYDLRPAYRAAVPDGIARLTDCEGVTEEICDCRSGGLKAELPTPSIGQFDRGYDVLADRLQAGDTLPVAERTAIEAVFTNIAAEVERTCQFFDPDGNPFALDAPRLDADGAAQGADDAEMASGKDVAAPPLARPVAVPPPANEAPAAPRPVLQDQPRQPSAETAPQPPAGVPAVTADRPDDGRIEARERPTSTSPQTAVPVPSTPPSRPAGPPDAPPAGVPAVTADRPAPVPPTPPSDSEDPIIPEEPEDPNLERRGLRL